MSRAATVRTVRFIGFCVLEQEEGSMAIQLQQRGLWSLFLRVSPFRESRPIPPLRVCLGRG
jgi:hypothetical protein